MKQRLQKWGIRLLLLFGSILVCLVVLEFLVRLVMPQQLIELRPDVYRPVEGIGHTLRPNLDTTINLGEREVRLLTDTNGYRTNGVVTDEAEVRVLALGDSFTEAMHVEYDETVVGLLETSLSESLGQTVSVVNTAVSAYNPNHYLIRARDELAENDYDLVLVFVYVGNDIVGGRREAMPPRAPTLQHDLRLPRSLSGAEWVDALLYPLNDTLEQHSHLFVLSKNSASLLLARMGLTASYFPEVLLTSFSDSDKWANTADILQDIADLAAEFDTPTLVVILPSVAQVNADEFIWYQVAFGIDPADVDLDQPGRLLTAELEARNVPVTDATPVLREAYEQGVPDLYGRVHKHFNANGHRVVAAFILPQVEAVLLND